MAKFMPCYDGPYTITDVDEQHSTVTLDLPNSPNKIPTFHTLQVIPYIESDTEMFPSRHFEEPNPIITEDGIEEQFIDKILDARRHGCRYQYLVRWRGFGQNMTNGYLALNWKTLKHLISGQPLGMDLLDHFK